MQLVLFNHTAMLWGEKFNAFGRNDFLKAGTRKCYKVYLFNRHFTCMCDDV